MDFISVFSAQVLVFVLVYAVSFKENRYLYLCLPYVSFKLIQILGDQNLLEASYTKYILLLVLFVVFGWISKVKIKEENSLFLLVFSISLSLNSYWLLDQWAVAILIGSSLLIAARVNELFVNSKET